MGWAKVKATGLIFFSLGIDNLTYKGITIQCISLDQIISLGKTNQQLPLNPLCLLQCFGNLEFLHGKLLHFK